MVTKWWKWLLDLCKNWQWKNNWWTGMSLFYKNLLPPPQLILEWSSVDNQPPSPVQALVQNQRFGHRKQSQCGWGHGSCFHMLPRWHQPSPCWKISASEKMTVLFLWELSLMYLWLGYLLLCEQFCNADWYQTKRMLCNGILSNHCWEETIKKSLLSLPSVTKTNEIFYMKVGLARGHYKPYSPLPTVVE